MSLKFYWISLPNISANKLLINLYFLALKKIKKSQRDSEFKTSLKSLKILLSSDWRKLKLPVLGHHNMYGDMSDELRVVCYICYLYLSEFSVLSMPQAQVIKSMILYLIPE